MRSLSSLKPIASPRHFFYKFPSSQRQLSARPNACMQHMQQHPVGELVGEAHLEQSRSDSIKQPSVRQRQRHNDADDALGSSASTPRLLLIPPNISPSACVHMCVDYARRVESLGSPEGLNSESKTSVADGLTFSTDVSSSMYPTNPDCACSNGFHPNRSRAWTGRRRGSRSLSW